MSQRPPPTQHRPPQTREQSRSDAQTAPPPSASRQAQRPAEQLAPEIDSATQQDLQIEQETATAGRDGERNITINWTFQWCPGYRTAWFDIATAEGHGIEAEIQQLSYRKKMSGTTHLKTELLPRAPVGTKGQLVVKDTTTGETAVWRWVWVSLGGAGFWAALWKLIKGMFVK